MLAFFAIVFGVVFFDQLSKWLVVVLLKPDSVAVIPKIVNFSYIENRGMAFGWLKNSRWVFMILSCVAIVALCIYLYRTHKTSILQNIAVAFIIGGGIGNMIDRVLLGYVIDFIDFCAFPTIWYYTFNVADAFVCVGAGLMILYLLRDIIREIKAEKAKKAALVESDAKESAETSENTENVGAKNAENADAESADAE